MGSVASVLHGNNAPFLLELYQQFLNDPNSVDGMWRRFFEDVSSDIAELSTPTSVPKTNGVQYHTALPLSGQNVRQETLDSIQALMMIRAYRVRGHLYANLDPLGLQTPAYHPELDYKTYGFTEQDLDRPIFINHVLGLETATLRHIIEVLNKTYCHHIGVEFMHIQTPEEKSWVQERVEHLYHQPAFSKEEQLGFLEQIIHAETFEQFLAKKYTGTKKFGVDGGESTLLCLEEMIKVSAALGVEDVVIGMAHRGRLNILANMMGKPFKAIFSEFHGNAAHPEEVQGSGDVKYHLGTSSDRYFGNHRLHLSLTANPSHLEAVNTVVLGKVRAKQNQIGDVNREKVMGLLIHGDAAFSGQGLVPEALELSQLKGYRTGGTIHLIINNQIGFTTLPAYSRSGLYCTEPGKIVNAPIFHVNGDDPEAVANISRIAAEFRQKFKKDVIIDLVCYRRFGHNEADEPGFTQPLMYKRIAIHPSVVKLYETELLKSGIATESEIKDLHTTYNERLEADFKESKSFRPSTADWLQGKWSGLERAPEGERKGSTGVNGKTLQDIGIALSTPPKGLVVHSKIVRQLQTKKQLIESGAGIDWATAESLAFGSLLVEGYSVRLSGQDSARGTFSQRHSAWIDFETEEAYLPLNHLSPDQETYEVIDSPLSEAGVLGFEYGYSLAEPNKLVIWEAQFGDFVNGAQVIIDQFISSGENKWLRMSGLVMLLPHGYEGQGPEHSSARIERFLQLSAEDNWQVVNCTTPANYFHVLRRQLKRSFRKPLIVATPKSLLRHRLCVSKLDEMAEDTSFHRVLADPLQPKKDSDIKRVILCSGKVFYDLFEQREKHEAAKEIHILRLEQLYPFPDDTLEKELKRFPQAEVIWCQEEPKNMGAWSFVDPLLIELLMKIKHKQFRASYAGRAAAASPATGLLSRHNLEQKTLIETALGC